MTGAPMAEEVAFGRVDKLGLALVLSVVVGWLAFVALALFLIGGAVRDEAKRETAQRALSSAYALAAALEARGADAAGQQAVLATFVGQAPGVIAARIVDAERRELAASTAAADVRDAPAPRALKPVEKQLYDRARSLSAARIANNEANRRPQATARVVGDAGAAFATVLLNATLGQARTVELSLEGAWSESIAPVLAAPALAGLAIILLLLTAAPVRWRPMAAVALLALTCIALTITQARLHQDAAVTRAEAAIGDTVDHIALVSQGLGGAQTPLDRTIMGAEGAAVRASLRIAEDAALARSLAAAGLLALALAAFGAFGWAGRTAAAIRDHRKAYIYIAPAMIGLILLSFFPFFYGLSLSLTNPTLLNQDQLFAQRFVGLENHAQILADFDFWQGEAGRRALGYTNFYWTLGVTLLWAIANLIIGLGVGLALAVMLNTKGLMFTRLYRALLILPWAIPSFTSALAWRGLFQPEFSAATPWIAASGGAPLAWFGNELPSFLDGVITNSWLSFPFMLMVCFGALQSMDESPIETAKIEGASAWRRFRHVTLPLLAPALLPAVMVSVVWTFNMVSVSYLVSASQSGGSTNILITRDSTVAFEDYRNGFAATYAVVILAILLIYSWWHVRLTRATP
jgi:arabinogalactan oligomer / maltooligosaccharide transport system permease protein